MGFFSTAKRIIKPFVDFPRWMDAKQIINTTKKLYQDSKQVFAVKVSSAPADINSHKSFKAAVKRFNLSEVDLNFKQRSLLLLSHFYFFASLIVIVYSLYLLFFHFSLIGGPTALVIGLVLGALAFQRRFWFFQIKTRRLNYTLREWFYLDVLKRSLPVKDKVIQK